MLLSQYQEDFSAYTLKRFMDDYTSTERMRSERPPAERLRVETLQREFSLIKVKVLLVSLNRHRDRHVDPLFDLHVDQRAIPLPTQPIFPLASLFHFLATNAWQFQTL